MRFHTVLVLCHLFLIIKNGDCLKHIYSSVEKESFSEEVQFDPDNRIFPVINHYKHCSHNITHCPISNQDHKENQVTCNFENLCPKGTRPQCVENEEHGWAWKGILWICSPYKTCDRGSRDIVYFDPNKPDVYQLGTKRCPDGHYYDEIGYCFSKCKQDISIRVIHESTPERGPIVCCNYPGYCSTEKPKLFEYKTDEPSPCKLTYVQELTSCPADSERMSDCKCDTRCKNGFKRYAEDDFICKRPPLSFNPETKLRLSDVLSIRQHSSSICLIWDFPPVNNLTVSTVEVSYLDIVDNHETYVNQSSNTSTSIDGLVPRKVYVITANILYRFQDYESSYTQKYKETMQPRAVVNITVITNGDIIELKCFASKKSRQDHFNIEYRMVRRNRKTSWVEEIATDCTFKLNKPFPGEEYEFKVSAVSNNVSSTEEIASIIVPPRPPNRLRYSFPSSKHVTLFWSHDELVSHVEEWYLTYISSDGDVGKKEFHSLKNEMLVETTLDKLTPGQKYVFFVISSVGGVNSSKSEQIEFKMPEEGGESSKPWVYVIVGCVVFVGLGCVAAVLFWKYKPQQVRINQNITNIGKMIKSYKAGRDMHIEGEKMPESIPLRERPKTSASVQHFPCRESEEDGES